MTELPIYSAKKLGSDETVEGELFSKKLLRGPNSVKVWFIKYEINISGYNEDGTQKTNNWDTRESEIDPATVKQTSTAKVA